MLGTRRQRAGFLTATAAVLLASGSSVTAHAIVAKPPPDCNTPNGSGGIGVLEQPQSIDPSTHGPFLTKTLSNTVSQPGSTTYVFTLQTTRANANDTGAAGVSYTPTSLTDPSKTWTANQWANASVSANAGAETGTVISNTATTLNLAAAWAGGTPA